MTEFLAKLETLPPPFSADYDEDESQLDLSNTKMNPYTLWKMLERLGYKKTGFRSNGWEFDFWMDFEKPGCKSLLVWGTGITFNLWLTEAQKY